MKEKLLLKLFLFVLKMKGVKKVFSQDPINYRKLRKEDVKRPKGRFYTKKITNRFQVLDTEVTEVAAAGKSKRLIIYLPGGAFVSGPAQHHWDSIKKIHQDTNHTIWVVDYPKAPETKITEISKNVLEVYKLAIEKYDPATISLIGDSVGGTLIVGLIQKLIQMKMDRPQRIVLISPVLDASLSNPQSYILDETDPMLSAKGFLSAKSMCAENNDLKAPNISPIYGDFQEFPETILYLADNDITYPDQLTMVDKLNSNNVPIEVITGKGMPHIWPLLPVLVEAKVTLDDIITKLK